MSALLTADAGMRFVDYDKGWACASKFSAAAVSFDVVKTDDGMHLAADFHEHLVQMPLPL